MARKGGGEKRVLAGGVRVMGGCSGERGCICG